MEAFPSAFIDRFTLAGEIVSGSETVYRATEKSLNRQVAVKFLAPDLIRDDESRNRFLNEGNALAKVRHQNLVEVFDVDANDERPFIVLQYVEGFSLKEGIARIGTIPLRHACDYMLQICEGLGAIHSEKLIHCNLKPRNILIDSLGVVKILDFGFVLTDGSSSADGDDGRVLGTPAYMSPEQARGKKVGVQTDIYAAGIIFYEMVAGSTPFWGSTAKDVMKSHVKNKVPSLREFNPLLPKKLRAIIYRMLNKKLAKRYDTTKKIIRDLNAFLSTDGWQKEIGDARKTFAEHEADDSYKGIKGPIGSSQRIKAARGRIDDHIRLLKERKARKIKKSKHRTKVAWLRTVFVCLVLISSLMVVFSDSTSIVRLRNIFSKIGVGSVANLVVSQSGRQVIVSWDTSELSRGQIRLISPFSQYFQGKSANQAVLHHDCIIEGAFKDGEKLDYVIVNDDGVESPVYSHTFFYNALIGKITVDSGVATAFVEISTTESSTCTMKIKGESGANILFAPSASAKRTKPSTVAQCLFFSSNTLAKKHSFSVSALPSGESYLAELKVCCPPAHGGLVMVTEQSFKKFSTKEPEFSDFYVLPSGTEITGSLIVTDKELIFSSDDGFLHSVSVTSRKLLWKTPTHAIVAGSPVLDKDTIYLNLVNGDVLGVSRIDGTVLWKVSTAFKWSQAPTLQGNDRMALVSESGRLSLWSISEKKEKSFVDTGKEIYCPPLAADGLLYVVDTFGYLTCIQGTTATILWDYRTGNKLLATPTIWNKYLFLPAMDGNFYAIYRDRGVVSWRKQLGNLGASVAFVSEAGSSPGQIDIQILYFIAVSKDLTRLVKLNALGGTTLWDVPVDKTLQGTPVVSEGRIYAAGTDGIVYCYSAIDGLKLWSIDTGTEIRGAPVVGEGDLFVANSKGSIIRIRD